MDDGIVYLRPSDLKVLKDMSPRISFGETLPDITHLNQREQKLVKAMALWIETARAAKPPWYYSEGWYPRDPDFEKSRLFWRIRTGRMPLPDPPPCAFSCPWYEVVEEDQPHRCTEVSLNSTWEDHHHKRAWLAVRVNQETYKLVKKISDTEALVQFGRHKYRVWQEGPDSDVRLKLHRPDGIDGIMRVFFKNWAIQRLMAEPDDVPWFPWWWAHEKKDS